MSSPPSSAARVSAADMILDLHSDSSDPTVDVTVPGKWTVPDSRSGRSRCEHDHWPCWEKGEWNLKRIALCSRYRVKGKDEAEKGG